MPCMAVRLATGKSDFMLKRKGESRLKRKHTVGDAVGVAATEDGILAVVGEATDLLNVSGWKTVSVSLVVDKFRGDIVVKLKANQDK